VRSDLGGVTPHGRCFISHANLAHIPAAFSSKSVGTNDWSERDDISIPTWPPAPALFSLDPAGPAAILPSPGLVGAV
jgi:hypothetical protein